ncbi:MAG: hypothetical protein ACOX23_00955 [Peptococcia bacterium]|jgi:hypothetical protein
MTKRWLTALLVLLLSCSLLVGCNLFKKGPNAQDTPPQDNGTQTQEDMEQTGSGIYQGQIDSNSVEIEINENGNKVPRAFQLSDELKAKLAESNLNTGDNITFTYEVPDVGQPILKEIKKEQ